MSLSNSTVLAMWEGLGEEDSYSMNLVSALPLVFHESKRITRRTWHNPRIFVSLEQGQLCIKGYSSSGPDDGKPHPWTVTESDWFAEDWEVVE